MTRKEILPGIFLNHVQSDKFKLSSLSFTILTQLKRETASMNALIPSVLCRGSRNYDTLDKLSCRFEELYGSSVSCMVKKYGEIQAVSGGARIYLGQKDVNPPVIQLWVDDKE